MSLYSIQLESPELQGVYLVGETVPIRYKILQGDMVIDAKPLTIALNDEPIQLSDALVLEEEGRYKLFFQYYGVSETVIFYAIRPRVVSIEFLPGPDGDNLYHLYDYHACKRTHPYYRVHYKDWEGESTEAPEVLAHPACYRMGTRPTLRVHLHHPRNLHRARRIDVVAMTQKLSDEGCPTSREPYAGQAMVFRLPQEMESAGIEVTEWPIEIELIANRPLPFKVDSYSLDLSWFLKILSKEEGWEEGLEDFTTWRRLEKLTGVKLFSIWKEPRFLPREGYAFQDDLLCDPEFDAFHVERACTWASGAWNLRLDDPGSIPLKLGNFIHHYYYPKEYEGKEGKPASEHKRPGNYSALHVCPVVHPPQERVCALCGGPIDGAGVCTNCFATACEKIACRSCRGPVNEELSVCESEGLFLGRWVNGAIVCSRCGHKNPATLSYCDRGYDLTYFTGGGPCPLHTGEDERHPLTPLDHCLRCGTLLARVIALCPACRQWVPEEDILLQRHHCIVEPTLAVDEYRHFMRASWGWGVLDNPVAPGGQCHQQTSLYVTALLCLGVWAEMFYIKARPDGALLIKNHDPVTRGADCFDPKRDWGRNFHAIVSLDMDPSIHPNLREDREICYDIALSWPGPIWPLEEDTGPTRCVLREAVTGSHDRFRWSAVRSDHRCRCGHAMDPESQTCPTCGAQPTRAYRCRHCGESLVGDEYDCTACDAVLKGHFFASIVYPCPGCGETVHEADGACWNCGIELIGRNLLEE
jgi:hypothetical protein